MSVNSYLTSLSSKLVLKESEKEKIKTSISTLETRLNYYFTNINSKTIDEKILFGSYTRGTILPRKADEGSDIDYMIVFANHDKYKPATLLKWLREFVEYYYSTSEIYPSHPTIVLELNHIKFELVPAFNTNREYSFMPNNYMIPASSSNYSDWIDTDPIKLNSDLTNKNIAYDYLIKPSVRLLKYWNVLNGKIYSSYKLEEIAISLYYNISNPQIIEILNTIVQALPLSGLSQVNQIKVKKLKSELTSIKADMILDPNMSERNIKKIFLDISI